MTRCAPGAHRCFPCRSTTLKLLGRLWGEEFTSVRFRCTADIYWLRLNGSNGSIPVGGMARARGGAMPRSCRC